MSDDDDEMKASAPSGPPAAPGWPNVGDVNVLEASVGMKGYGKSTHQCVRVYELQRQLGGAYVIGHSLGQRMPERLPPELHGGAALPIVYHSTLESLDRGVSRHPARWHILSVPMREEDPSLNTYASADDLLKYAIQLSLRVRQQAWRREHPLSLRTPSPSKTRFYGLPAPAIIVICDEGIAVGGASPGARGRDAERWFLEFIYSLRHLHIALFYAIQEPTSRSWRVLDAATAVHCFRVKHAYAVEALRAAGANDDQVDMAKHMERFKYFTLT